MPQEPSIWFRLGYAAERAVARVTPSALRETDEERLPRPRRAGDGSGGDALDRILAAGAGAVLTRVVEKWGGGERPGMGALVRAGAAGAAAALLLEFARPLLTEEELTLDRNLVSELLAGAGAGLVYASLVEPRVPGPLPLRGAVYGTAEYVTAAWGGLGRILRPLTPQERIPVVGDVLTDGMAEGRSYVEHLVFAVALAELYGEG